MNDRGESVPRWVLYLKALRAFSFPVAALPVLIACLAVGRIDALQWDLVVVLAVTAVLFNAWGNLLNDVFDYRSGVDHLEQDEPDRPGRYLVSGRLLPRELFIMALVAAGLLVPAAVYVGWRTADWGFVPYGLAGLIGAYAYTGPPLQTKYRALGELTVFVLFGPLLMAAVGRVLVGHIVPEVLVLSIPVGMMTAGILAGNNVRDYDEDADSNITTLARLLGKRAALVLYVALVVGAPTVLLGLAFTRWGAPLFALAPLGLIIPAGAIRRMITGRRVADIDARTAMFETVILGLMVVALALHGPVT
ncbi:MAG: prenyltransferase [Planctomycetota bacterium]